MLIRHSKQSVTPSSRRAPAKRVPARATRTTRTPGKGATTIAREVEPRKWGRVVLLALCLGGVAAGLAQINWPVIFEKTRYAANKPLASIKIEGEFRFVSKGALQNLILPKLNGSFVDLNLREVKESIEANPWVKSVTVERIWPDSLKLRVTEQAPIARWNNDGFINREGTLVKVESNAALASLPSLSGDDDKSNTLAKNYVFFSELLKINGLNITALRVDSTMSWSMVLEQGFELVLGRDEIHEKLESFSFIYNKYLSNKTVKIDRVDMRYEKGLAVKWKDDTQLAVSQYQ